MKRRGAQHARFLADLSPRMSQALVRCHTLTVLAVTDPDSPGGPASFGIHRATLAALIGHDLIDQQRDKRARPVWKPTARGLVIIRAEEPRYLARSSDHLDHDGADAIPGYTTDAAMAMFPDPGEAVDEITQARITAKGRDDHAARRAGVDDLLLAELQRDRARRQELVRIANERGIQVRDELRMVDRAVASLERKIRAQTGNRRAA